MKKSVLACLFLNVFVFTQTEAKDKINIAEFFLANVDQGSEWNILSESPCRTHNKTGKLFIFDPKQHKWFACDNGEEINTGKASGGRDGGCSDIGYCRTPEGTFSIYRKEGKECTSSIFPLDPDKPRARMPYCMFFSGGYAIHGSDNIPDGKNNLSHGCIRVDNAEWLYGFLDYGTPVRVLPYPTKSKKYEEE